MKEIRDLLHHSPIRLVHVKLRDLVLERNCETTEGLLGIFLSLGIQKGQVAMT